MMAYAGYKLKKLPVQLKRLYDIWESFFAAKSQLKGGGFANQRLKGLTTYHKNAAENREPQLQNKSGAKKHER
jgi:hypothetical protein